MFVSCTYNSCHGRCVLVLRGGREGGRGREREREKRREEERERSGGGGAQ